MSYSYTRIELPNNAATIGQLFGNVSTSDCLKQIAQNFGYNTSYFGSDADPTRNMYAYFREVTYAPYLQTAECFKQANAIIDRQDVFTPITTIEQLKEGPPPCMWVPILMYPPMMELLKDEKICGYGYDPNSFPEVDPDPYGRLINNGTIQLINDNTVFNDKNDPNAFYVEEVYTTYDPKVTEDELNALEKTRKFLDMFMTAEDTMYLDPTNPFELRG